MGLYWDNGKENGSYYRGAIYGLGFKVLAGFRLRQYRASQHVWDIEFLEERLPCFCHGVGALFERVGEREGGGGGDFYPDFCMNLRG